MDGGQGGWMDGGQDGCRVGGWMDEGQRGLVMCLDPAADGIIPLHWYWAGTMTTLPLHRVCVTASVSLHLTTGVS